MRQAAEMARPLRIEYPMNGVYTQKHNWNKVTGGDAVHTCPIGQQRKFGI